MLAVGGKGVIGLTLKSTLPYWPPWWCES